MAAPTIVGAPGRRMQLGLANFASLDYCQAMSIDNLKRVTIIGVGLLGGSAGLAIKAAAPMVRVAGVGRRMESLQQALTVGAVDTAHLDAAAAVTDADMVILATPVGAFEAHLRAIARALPRGCVVTDVGSTKQQVVRAAHRIMKRSAGCFVGSHPMAGSEQRGPAYARKDLFAGATCIVTPTAATKPAALDKVQALWRALGMRLVTMTPAAHDAAVAAISHLPHAMAAMLMLLPGDRQLEVSASGFRDATRLASGDVEIWRDIFLTNRANVAAQLGKLRRSLEKFTALLERGDGAAIGRFLDAARTRRERTILNHEDRRATVE